MWLRTSSVSPSRMMPKAGWLSVAFLAGWGLIGATWEVQDTPAAIAHAVPSPSLDVGPWKPPWELAENIRSTVAKRWALPSDELVIEWREPDDSIEGFLKPARLLGPGRGGSWIALLEDGTRRASLRFRAGVRVPTPLATSDLPRARTLVATDIEWQDIVAWGAPEEPDLRPREGWITRRPISAGEPLRSPLVNPRPVVRSGSNVNVRWTTGRVTVELPGRAVGDAVAGADVSVRLNTGLRVRGTAIDSITVELRATPAVPASRPARRAARSRPDHTDIR